MDKIKEIFLLDDDNPQTPETKGEQDMGGSMPAPESDDDTLQEIKEWGLHIDEDEEHPEKELRERDVFPNTSNELENETH